jgi:hypothetical protein
MQSKGENGCKTRKPKVGKRLGSGAGLARAGRSRKIEDVAL